MIVAVSKAFEQYLVFRRYATKISSLLGWQFLSHCIAYSRLIIGRTMGQSCSSGTGAAGKPLVSLIHCPLTGKRLVNPVIASDGWSYERQAIVEKLAKGMVIS